MTVQMKQMVWRGIAVVLAAALSLSMVGGSRAQDVSINTRVGFVNGYENAEAARTSGAGWEIVRFRWDQLQPNGPADWNTDGPTGDYVGSAQSLGREIVPVLVGTPSWATDDTPGIGVPTGLYLPASDPGNTWAGFVRQAVGFYAAQGVNHWIIWEDMDIPEARAGATWAGTEEDYYQLIKVAYTVAKEANPNAVIHVGGVGTFDSTWFNRFLDVAIEDEDAAENNYYFDIASLNMYYAPDRVGTQTANMFFVMGQKGMALKPVWVTKTNARPAVDDAYPDDATFREFQRVTQEQQAAFIVQAFAEGFAAGADRIAAYRLVDNLAEDEQQAYGLMRADGTSRQAFTAFQIAAEHLNGFVFARNVNEEAHPLMDYVRLTAADKVTHIVWARTEANATIIIPARSDSAMLIDIHNNQWEVTPDGVNYRIAVEGANCNEPSAPAGCLIGGAPWILVEEGVANALSEVPPNINVVEGGTPPTPDPSFALTATARALPTPTPTVAPTETSAPQATPTTEVEGETVAEAPATEQPPLPVEATQVPAEAVEQPTEPPVPTPEPVSRFLPGQPHGFVTAVPFILIVLGVLVIGGGAGFYLTDGYETIRQRLAARGDEQVDWDRVVDDDADWAEGDETAEYDVDDGMDDAEYDEEEYGDSDPSDTKTYDEDDDADADASAYDE